MEYKGEAKATLTAVYRQDFSHMHVGTAELCEKRNTATKKDAYQKLFQLFIQRSKDFVLGIRNKTKKSNLSPTAINSDQCLQGTCLQTEGHTCASGMQGYEFGDIVINKYPEFMHGYLVMKYTGFDYFRVQ